MAKAMNGPTGCGSCKTDELDAEARGAHGGAVPAARSAGRRRRSTNPLQFRTIRRDIARIKTILQREGIGMSTRAE